MLDAHYRSKINISDYWAVGDNRTVSITKTSSSVTLPNGSTMSLINSYGAQDLDIIILGFDHDNLSTPINGKTKAAVTLNLKRCINGPGQMHGNSTAGTMWSNCGRRAWCNSNFLNALPSDLSKNIKSVTKLTNQVGDSSKSTYTKQETTTDKVFILSCNEVTGTRIDISIGSNRGLSDDGTLYKYMETSANRTKQIPGYTTSTWWIRSSYVVEDSNTYVSFGYINQYGNVGTNNADVDDYGIAPAFCL